MGVDLHAEGFGRMAVVTYMHLVDGGGGFIVANSFEEWLERTLDLGPNARAPYWYQPGFKDLGPLIPEDPYYEPFEGGFLGPV